MVIGHLLKIEFFPTTSVIVKMIAVSTEREKAKRIAALAVAQPDWGGPRQVIFLHRDQTIELWDRELREGWNEADSSQ